MMVILMTKAGLVGGGRKEQTPDFLGRRRRRRRRERGAGEKEKRRGHDQSFVEASVTAALSLLINPHFRHDTTQTFFFSLGYDDNPLWHILIS